MALTDNLISYWKLNESSGNASDSVWSNTLTNNWTVTYTTGKIWNWADFWSTWNTKSLRTPSTLGIDGWNITISAWVKKKANITSGKYCFAWYQKNGTSKVEYRLWIDNSSGTEKIWFTRGKIWVADNNAQYTTTLDTSNFHHIVGTYDWTNAIFYLDWTQQATVASSGNWTTVLYTDWFSLWMNNNNDSFIENNFIVDEVWVWSRALSSTEISELYNSWNWLGYPFTAFNNSSFLMFF